MYLALYRKYRPKTFDDVISQEHITTTLKNQIINSSTGHAYLFTGSRGTGKTTCAKILAMAMNCEHPINGNPCLECESCKAIAEGYSPDVIEMDAASNNKVENARDLCDEVNYTPISCKYKVYIIDEVHMLTPQAFNALLKTIEEPPEHIKFILATTELHKVLPTIVSRCQRFEFRRVDPSDSAKRLLCVAQQEGVKLDKDAAELIARLSDGGMRDALSMLDRCIAAEDVITSAVVRDCAGVADNSHLFEFSRMTAAGDTAGCIKLLTELYNNSKDISLIIDELMEHYRDLMIYKTAPEAIGLLSALPDEVEKLADISESYTLENILRCLTLLQQCADSIGKVKQRKIAAEMCFVKMCVGAEPISGNGKSVTKQTAVKVVEIPEEKFIPTPTEQLSRESIINLNRTRALAEETAKTIARAAQHTPPPAEQPPVPDEPPVFSSSPSEPEVIFTAAAEALPEENEVSEKNIETASAETIPQEQKAAVFAGKHTITPEEWEKAVNSMDPMNKTLFEKSEAEFDTDNMLVIRSHKQLLIDNLRGEVLESYEKQISEALGYEVHIRTELLQEAPQDKEELSVVDRLLLKARQLNIEIKQI